MKAGGIKALVCTLLVGACAPVAGPATLATVSPDRGLPVRQAAKNFVAAVSRVEPVAESYCRRIAIARRCDFLIVVDDRPGQAPNAFQMLAPDGRPVLGFTLGLIADAENTDEIAFVMGHEASHHILGHIALSEKSAREGALLAGLLAQVGGGSASDVRRAQRAGASVGARRFSKGFEIAADELGAEITEKSGFSAIRGAEFFNRIPDPGDQFLGTHPPNRDRIAAVRTTVARLR